MSHSASDGASPARAATRRLPYARVGLGCKARADMGGASGRCLRGGRTTQLPAAEGRGGAETQSAAAQCREMNARPKERPVAHVLLNITTWRYLRGAAPYVQYRT